MAVKVASPDSNLLLTPGIVAVPSSEQTSMPIGNIFGSRPSVRWRSKPGWTIGNGENLTLRFNRGGIKTAFLAASYYSTPAATAEAVRVAMEAADATPVWACTYAANKFTISSDLAFTLEFGTVATASVHPDLGFASVTTGSATSHTAGSVAYQSRQWINVDLGVAAPITSAFVRGHNVSAGSAIYVDINPFTMIGEAVGGGFSRQTLVGTDPRAAHFSSISEQYLRLVIEDVQNADGYAEVGVWLAGAASTLTVNPSVQYSVDKEHLSEVLYAEGGAHHQVPRARRKVYRLRFQFEERNGLAVADRAAFDAIDALGIGTNFFLTFDAPSEPGLTVYGYNRVGLHEVYDRGTLWAIVMEFAEALG